MDIQAFKFGLVVIKRKSSSSKVSQCTFNYKTRFLQVLVLNDNATTLIILNYFYPHKKTGNGHRLTFAVLTTRWLSKPTQRECWIM